MNQSEFDFEKKREAASAGVIDRIKKLLRLAAGKANRHESELALKLAFELARKYDVDVESIDLNERTARITHEWFKTSKRLDFLQFRALGVVRVFFRIDFVIGSGRVLFVGLPTDITIAEYVFHFIVRAGRAELRAYEIQERASRRRMSTGKRKNFIQGFIYGIITQLSNAEEELAVDDSKTALAVAEEVARKRHSEEVCPNTRPVKRRNAPRNETALERGYQRGRNTLINTPLGNGDEKEAPLALTNG